MATTTLVSQEIEEGKRLIDALNAANLSVDSALWIYAPEPETWRLMLTSPLHDREGSLKTYGEILSVFRQVKPDLKIDWIALVAVSPKHELIEGLRQSQQDWNLNLSGTRLTNNFVDRTWIEDAYIYQIK
ncbi:hypothetical protein K4039_16195 [Lyngbya sp. CCAP 1446/10]|uniref:hypothetical protein n=1 Tax=Lyngbya sp. CCAP 1446/10 TaxID=439293 RepID=UPI0022373059|nr:hypothetical protein [Lyngbya sp. CCAP 1446/10]MCW6051584.1 hypothetical protein [Lyngbya sp. CCAP 1446/10]